MGSKANQSHSSLQTLDFLPFLLPFSLKNEIAHIMSPKTTFLVFISLKSIRPLTHLSVRPFLAYTLILIPHFLFFGL